MIALSLKIQSAIHDQTAFVPTLSLTCRSDLSKKKIEYKEVLSPEDFSIYAKLRDWRKETAAREAVQLYNVFMNEQMAVMVQKRVNSKATSSSDADLLTHGQNSALSSAQKMFERQKVDTLPGLVIQA